MKYHPQTGKSTRGALNPCLAKLRLKLAKRFCNQSRGIVSQKLLYQTVIEAEALAATTSSPLLVFPTLAEEMVGVLEDWGQRQLSVRARKPAL